MTRNQEKASSWCKREKLRWNSRGTEDEDKDGESENLLPGENMIAIDLDFLDDWIQWFIWRHA